MRADQKNTGPKPPQLATLLLRWMLDGAVANGALGDLEERFAYLAAEHGLFRARLYYWAQIPAALPGFVGNSFYWSNVMIKSYLLVTLRNMMKHKAFSLINISGLSIGLACCLLISLWVVDELSFDTHHEKAARIYRLGSQFGIDEGSRGSFTPPPLAAALNEDFPEIEAVARLSLWPRNILVASGERQFLERGIIYADSSIFDIFTITMLQGDPSTALARPRTVVVTESLAARYFDGANPVGEEFVFDNEAEPYLVTGLVKDCPANSHFRFEMIASLVTLPSSRETGWGGNCYHTYFLLRNESDPNALETKLPAFTARHYGRHFQSQTGMSFEEHIRDGENYYCYWMQPLPEIHLNTSRYDPITIKGSSRYVFIFSSTAVFILLIACINFMNLSTARAAWRSREVGIRKVVGAGRAQLVGQFLGEAVFMSLIAAFAAALLVEFVLPWFNGFSGKELSIDWLGDHSSVALFTGAALITGLLAGGYPAFFISAYRPTAVLKGSRGTVGKGGRLRSALVVFQFAVSIVILMVTLTIFRQLHYLQKVELGFEDERVVVVHRARSLGRSHDMFREDLLQHSGIDCVSNTSSLPGRHFNPNSHRIEGDPPDREHTLYTMYGDYDFADLLGLELLEGRFFDREIASDATHSVVINETAARELGLADPIGARFHKEFGDAGEGEFVTVIGVLKDFHIHSLHHEIFPMVIRPLPHPIGNFTSARIRSSDLAATVSYVESAWRRHSGGQPFEYSFLDTDFGNLYRTERKTGTLFTLFSVIAVTIACLGQFALASYAAQRRIKEIGIRRVLGSSVSGIIKLLSKECVILVFISTMIAFPIAWRLMSGWLENFAFRVSGHLWTFALSGAAALAIALVTVGWQALRAARANPVESLRYE